VVSICKESALTKELQRENFPLFGRYLQLAFDKLETDDVGMFLALSCEHWNFMSILVFEKPLELLLC